MKQQHYHTLSGGIFLIGLGLLFLLPGVGFWPWILAVIGAAGLPESLAQNRGWMGWQGFFWMVGLAVLFASGYFWPGILILIGLSMLLGALMRESSGSPFASSGSRGGEATPFGLDQSASNDTGSSHGEQVEQER
ncbi:MAG: hypothetical protein JXA74_16855 [Anaerolineae bacterium]|nr:hypothetical protein [Anaerolineae bacterium]